MSSSLRASGMNKLKTDAPLNPCPWCLKPAELWEESDGACATKFVCCSTVDPTDDFGYQCPGYLPPACFHQATKREAIAYWNEHTRPAP